MNPSQYFHLAFLIAERDIAALYFPHEILQDQQVGLSQIPMKSLLFLCVLVYMRPWCAFQERSLCFTGSVDLLGSSPAGLQSQMLWGCLLLMADPKAGELDMELRPLLWENCEI